MKVTGQSLALGSTITVLKIGTTRTKLTPEDSSGLLLEKTNPFYKTNTYPGLLQPAITWRYLFARTKERRQALIRVFSLAGFKTNVKSSF